MPWWSSPKLAGQLVWPNPIPFSRSQNGALRKEPAWWRVHQCLMWFTSYYVGLLNRPQFETCWIGQQTTIWIMVDWSTDHHLNPVGSVNRRPFESCWIKCFQWGKMFKKNQVLQLTCKVYRETQQIFFFVDQPACKLRAEDCCELLAALSCWTGEFSLWVF